MKGGKKARENLTERVSLYKALCSDECWKEEIKLIGTMWYNYHLPRNTEVSVSGRFQCNKLQRMLDQITVPWWLPIIQLDSIIWWSTRKIVAWIQIYSVGCLLVSCSLASNICAWPACQVLGFILEKEANCAYWMHLLHKFSGAHWGTFALESEGVIEMLF